MQYSVAEQSALLLDGELVRLGDRLIHARTAVSPQLRVASIGIRFPRQCVLSHRLAAWVHGCAGYPSTLDVTVQAHHRQRIPSDPRVRVRRFRLDFRHDTVTIGAARVTSPIRTAVHLLGEPGCDAATLTSAALLAGGLEALREHVASAPRLRPSERARLLGITTALQPLVTL